MRLNENLGGGGGGNCMHFSHFPRTCPEQVLMVGNYTTRGKCLARVPSGFEPRRLSGQARCGACPGRYEMPRPSIPVGGTLLAAAQRGAVKAVRIHSSGCGHRDDRNAMPLERAVLERYGSRCTARLTRLIFASPGASRVRRLGASGSAWEPRFATPTAYGASQERQVPPA